VQILRCDSGQERFYCAAFGADNDCSITHFKINFHAFSEADFLSHQPGNTYPQAVSQSSLDDVDLDELEAGMS